MEERTFSGRPPPRVISLPSSYIRAVCDTDIELDDIRDEGEKNVQLGRVDSGEPERRDEVGGRAGGRDLKIGEEAGAVVEHLDVAEQEAADPAPSSSGRWNCAAEPQLYGKFRTSVAKKKMISSTTSGGRVGWTMTGEAPTGWQLSDRVGCITND